MNIHEYISSRGIVIDGLFVDKFWSALKNDEMVVIDKKSMEWLGYEDDAKGAQQSVTRLLEKYSIPYDKIDAGDDRCAQFPAIEVEKRTLSTNLLRKRWIFLTCWDFKHLAMFSHSSKIRIYFLTLDYAWKGYQEYVTVALHDAHAARDESITAALQPHVSKSPDLVDQEELIIILKMSPDYLYCEETDPEYVEESAAVIVRCQKRAVTNRLRGMRKWGDETNAEAEVLLSLENVNAVDVVNHIRSHGRYDLVFQGLRLKKDQTVEDFVEYVESYSHSLYRDVIDNIRRILSTPCLTT